MTRKDANPARSAGSGFSVLCALVLLITLSLVSFALACGAGATIRRCVNSIGGEYPSGLI